jgi:hypothetical protein
MLPIDYLAQYFLLADFKYVLVSKIVTVRFYSHKYRVKSFGSQVAERKFYPNHPFLHFFSPLPQFH